MAVIWDKIRDKFSDWMAYFKILFLIFITIYLCLIIASVFFDGCFTLSCEVTNKELPNKPLSLIVMVFMELAAITAISLILPILVSTVRFIFYGAMTAFAVAAAIAITGLAFGMIYFIYIMFRDVGFWGGLISVFVAMGMFGLLGGRTRDYVTTNYRNGSDDGYIDRHMEWEAEEQQKIKAYQEQQADARARENEPGGYQTNHNLYGPNPYTNND